MRDELRVALAMLAVAGGTLGAQAPPQHGASQAAAKPSTSLSVTVDGAAVTLTPAQIASMPQMTVKVTNGHSGKQESYTGARLSDVLGKAGAKLGKETLHAYVVAGGTDGYWVLYSGEEVVPAVHTGEVIVATSVDGKPLENEGAMKLLSTEDRKPERWVRNLSRVDWKTGTE